MKNNILTLEQRILFSNIWTLSRTQADNLDAYFLLHCTGRELETVLIEPEDDFQPWKLRHATATLQCQFVRPHEIEDVLNSQTDYCYISCRIQTKSTFYRCIIMKAPHLSAIETKKSTHLFESILTANAKHSQYLAMKAGL